ncbi:hypothetical protein FRC05_000756 [Tulasnella sp. 425]|nr:hypothetical protein FRC05_000756 [Tulasnella sp. 425]
MWSVIYIDMRSQPGAVRRLVEMAKSSSLDVHISKFRTWIKEDEEDTFKAAVATAALKADQWGTLVLSGHFPEVQELYEWMPHSLPGLHSAMIHIQLESNPNVWVPSISAPKLRNLVVRGDSQFTFADCPELRELELVELSKYWGSPDVVWADNAQSYFARLSGACPCLEHLTFDLTYLKIQNHDPGEDVPNLPSSTWPSFPRLQTARNTGLPGSCVSPPCRFLQLYGQPLHDITLFLSSFSDLSGALVQVADTTAALGFTTERDLRPRSLRLINNTEEQMERVEQIKDDWGWISSNTRVRWYFPGSTLKEGVEGIGVGKAIVYACQALASASSKRWLNDNPNLGTRQQVEVILSILLDVCN